MECFLKISAKGQGIYENVGLVKTEQHKLLDKLRSTLVIKLSSTFSLFKKMWSLKSIVKVWVFGAWTVV